MTGLNIQLDPETLQPLVQAIVAEALTQLDADRAKIGNSRLAYGESEAAGLLGLRPYQLRDIRLRGQIGFTRGPGRRVMYQPADLLDYLAGRRVEATANGSEL